MAGARRREPKKKLLRKLLLTLSQAGQFPMATDITFALGILAPPGKGNPVGRAIALYLQLEASPPKVNCVQ